MESQNIDRLFREKLDQLEVTPSFNHWSLTKKRIKSGKKIVAVYWIAASVSLLFISWFVWPTKNMPYSTPIISEISSPVYLEIPEYALPTIKKKPIKLKNPETKAAINNPPKKESYAQMDIMIPEKSTEMASKKIDPTETIFEKTTALVQEEKKEIVVSKLIEPKKSTSKTTVKITYIASSNNGKIKVQNNNSAETLKKIIAFASKITPGEILMNIKMAKDSLLSKGLRNRISMVK